MSLTRYRTASGSRSFPKRFIANGKVISRLATSTTCRQRYPTSERFLLVELGSQFTVSSAWHGLLTSSHVCRLMELGYASSSPVHPHALGCFDFRRIRIHDLELAYGEAPYARLEDGGSPVLPSPRAVQASRSMKVALAIPPPSHIARRPYRRPRCSSALTLVFPRSAPV